MGRIVPCLVVSLACFLWGCDDEPDLHPDGGSPDSGAAVGRLEGRLFGALTRAPVAGATVEFGGVRTTTDAEGKFDLEGPATKGTVLAQAPDHVKGLQQASVPADGSAYLEMFAMPVGKAATLQAETGGAVAGPEGSWVQIPPDALVDEAGAPVAGEVEVEITPYLTKDPRQLAAGPGKSSLLQEGGAVGPFRPRGLVAVTLKQGGQRVNLGAGKSASIAMPAGGASSPKSAQLASLDEETGEYTSKGAIHKTSTSEGAVYKGKVSHFSHWSAAEVVEDPGCVRGCVAGASGAARVVATGVDSLFQDQTTVGDDGCFTFDVPSGGQLRVVAMDGAGGVASATGTAAGPEDSCEDLGTLTLAEAPPEDSSCPRGTVDCQGECVDVESDPLHCGGCGQPCNLETTGLEGTECVGGSCACPPDAPDECDGMCVDQNSDPTYCGGCAVMGCERGLECADGTCQEPDCPGDLVVWDGECIDPLSDERYCGTDPTDSTTWQDCTAGLDFPDDVVCIEGTCACADGLAYCGGEYGECIDTQTDVYNCGECGHSCGANAQCNEGTCECDDGFTDCGDGSTNCVDTDTNSSHCGTCGEPCNSEQFCEGGTCMYL
ncbi:MAG: hypothetical protein ACOCXM_02050 [Myxococcota bacterium]